MEKKKRLVSMLFQVAMLFFLGVVLIGAISYYALYSISLDTVMEKLEKRENGIAKDIVSYIEEYPAHRWLINYWYENYQDLEIEYDVNYNDENETRAKYRLLNRHQPLFEPEYATDEQAEALPPEDQKLYAEVIYSWMMTRLDSIARADDLNFLFGIFVEEPYDRQFVLFMTGKKEHGRGDEPGQYYPIGTVIEANKSQMDAAAFAIQGSPEFGRNGDGKYIDYYYPVAAFDNRVLLVGLTHNYDTIRNEVVSEVTSFGTMFMIFMIALALVCLLMILVVILRPLEIVQENIRLYKNTKDSKTVVRNLSQIKSVNELSELSDDVADLTREIDEYTDQITKITSERERIETELSLARRIQSAMLPRTYPLYPNRRDFEIYGSMTPAREIGGDFYDFFLMDDTHLCMMIADVSGKGIPAALFMMASKISLTHHMKRDFSPKTILEQVNNSIFKNNPEEMFVTVWLGVLDLVTGTLRAVNAGHECPMLMHPGEYFELVNDRHGFVLGGMMDVKYHEYELQMEPGSKLFVYTDGLIEAVNTRGQEFETYRVLAALNKVRNEKPEQIINQVREEEEKFVKGTRPFDDLTMLCLAYNGPKKEEEGEE